MAQASPPRILIAEDNPQGLELLEAYLSGTDYEVATATDGEATLRQVQAFNPDLLLLDIMMPKISGFEVCKRLKSNSATQGIVVLMITDANVTKHASRLNARSVLMRGTAATGRGDWFSRLRRSRLRGFG